MPSGSAPALQGLNLNAYLIMPIQRLPCRMLLAELLKHLEKVPSDGGSIDELRDALRRS